MRRFHHRTVQLGHEARSGAHEAGLGRRLDEHVEPRAADRLLDDQLALEVGRLAAAEAGSSGHLPEQPVEAHDARAEDRAAVGKLALRVLNVGDCGHHENRVVVQPGAQPAEHLARLGGVRGAGYELERHTEIVASPSDRLPARRSRRRLRALRRSARPAAAPALPAAPSPGWAA